VVEGKGENLVSRGVLSWDCEWEVWGFGGSEVRSLYCFLGTYAPRGSGYGRSGIVH